MGAARYNEIADDLLRRIDEGEWQAGETLPQMEKLAKHYDASRNVVARAVGKLAQEGRLVSVPRRGTVPTLFGGAFPRLTEPARTPPVLHAG